MKSKKKIKITILETEKGTSPNNMLISFKPTLYKTA